MLLGTCPLKGGPVIHACASNRAILCTDGVNAEDWFCLAMALYSTYTGSTTPLENDDHDGLFHSDDDSETMGISAPCVGSAA